MAIWGGIMNNILNQEIINKKKKKYSNQWSVTSDEYNKKGIYQWMASFLSDNQNAILEIGCGSGVSTLNLCNKAKKIISIDDNLECLKKSKKLLEEKGIRVRLIKRERIRIISNNKYETSYFQMKEEFLKDEQVLLIEGDILYDNNLINFLKSYKLFDTVVCWLIGTHQAKMYNNHVQQDDIKSDGDYRWSVEEHLCRLSRDLLVLGGRVHIVDRMKEPETEEQKQEIITCYKELFDYDVDFDGIKLNTVFLDNHEGIRLVNSVDNRTHIIDNHNLIITFVSLMFKKIN